MGDNESCRYVNSLINKYVKGQCTKAESALVEEHCATCKDCSSKLYRTIEFSQKASGKEILFLSRPKVPVVLTKPDTDDEKAENKDIFTSRRPADNGKRHMKAKKRLY